ncbi:UvrABC system protein C [Tolypothrix tenuis PCC 7101]|uniref:UvrABC system protein C n=1 Tax=Tolypothrix tenuis PCC 7101 TaxID=231146 RepID=A0A1Z4MV22_9CYAN|nr:GIY-YIG nuclease family protein [Aulosira sp. FACHB-113]BAY97329.1 UvrABC system protein C [Tolypothrix tenuis PCC 7101]BAZ72162.1 UvrABC system protein C [Aulosira laxa NIES-50]
MRGAAHHNTEVNEKFIADLLRARARLISNPPAIKLEKTIPYRQGFALTVPNTSGIYLFHDLRGVFYVGQSCDLRRRFDEHFWEKDNPLLARALNNFVGEVYFSFVKVNALEMNSSERQLIHDFYPLCNRILYLSSNN